MACSSDKPAPQAEASNAKNEQAELPYFQVSAFDSNNVIELRTVLSPKNEIEVHSNISDKITNILVKEGQRVKAGSQLLAYSSEKQAEFDLIIKNYEIEKKKYNSAKAKFEDEEISKQEYENIRTTYTLATKKYNAIKDKIALTAPIDGIVSAVLVAKGKTVSIGQSLFKIANIDTVQSFFVIDSEALKYINNKIIPEISINNETIKGKIDKINRTQNKEEFELCLSFPNLDNKLNTKDSVSIRIDTKQKKKQIIIPKNAIFVEGEDTYVTLILDDGTKRKTKVKIGGISGESIEVLSGLRSGDKILLR